MKKLSLKNLKLDGNDLLQREQLKAVFGGYEVNGTQCRCKNSNTGAAWFTGSLHSCDDCGSWCDNNVPTGSTYTSWICSGPLVKH